MSWTKRVPIHPLFLSLYPILAFLGTNLGQVKPQIATRAIFASILLGAIFWMVSRLILHDLTRAAILASLLVILFFTYGHVYESLRLVDLGGVVLGRHRYLVPLWIVFVGFCGWWSAKLQQLAVTTQILNALSTLLLVFPLGQLLLFSFQVIQPFENKVVDDPLLSALDARIGRPPDIYYIILDAYGGEAVLRSTYEFDNQAFLSELEGLGFQLASCSQSNYAQTDLSFASSLNFNYLDSLDPEVGPVSEDRSGLWPYIQNSAVRVVLEGIGYETIAFETGFSWSEIEDADRYMTPPREGFQGFNSFEMALLRSTAAWVLIDQIDLLPELLLRDLDQSGEENYRRINYVFGILEELPSGDSPVFVFAHIIAPHSPFVFGPEGSYLEGEPVETLDFESYAVVYQQEITYLNEQVLEALQGILNRSRSNAIILLQSDHGPEKGSAADRMSILNAYFLPEYDGNSIPEDISPVNSFRIIFNHYFDTEFELLEDVSFFSTYNDPFNFSVIPSRCGLD